MIWGRLATDGRKTLSAYGSYIVETFVTLLVVCAIAFVVLYGAKRLGMGRTSGAIELAGQLPLDARRCIYLVKVGGQVLVVGVSEAGFTKLAEMPEGALALESDAHSDSPHAPRAFSEVLARAFGARHPKTPEKTPPEPAGASEPAAPAGTGDAEVERAGARHEEGPP